MYWSERKDSSRLIRTETHRALFAANEFQYSINLIESLWIGVFLFLTEIQMSESPNAQYKCIVQVSYIVSISLVLLSYTEKCVVLGEMFGFGVIRILLQ